MFHARPLVMAVTLLTLIYLPALAQDNPPASSNPGLPAPSAAIPAGPPPAAAPAATAPTGVAATVNGQPIQESAVFRAQMHVPPAKRGEMRNEILNFLIDNALLDQYVTQQGISVDNKEVDVKVQQVREEVQKQGQGATFEKSLSDLMLTEAELRAQIAAQMRWDKFVDTQATDQALQDLFDHNREMFDGTMVRARHILLTPLSGDATANEQAKAKLLAFKKQIDDEVAQGLAKLPSTSDAKARDEARNKLVDSAFGAIARKESACPSKAQDGDLGYFPRSGGMVEPFAKTAFALKPFEVSDIVTTQFGYHLILVIDRRPGKEAKLNDVKDDVKELYGEKLRETLIARLRPSAKITVNPAPAN